MFVFTADPTTGANNNGSDTIKDFSSREGDINLEISILTSQYAEI